MKPNYDTVASFYDRFARLIFGKAQINAQGYLLQFIPPNACVLIPGGGSGWILEEIAKLHPSGLRITYVEASEKMMKRARKRNYGANEVSFITGYVEEIKLRQQYDIVVTPFLFDNLDEHTTEAVCVAIKLQLKTGGLWLYCDFEGAGSMWQRLMLGMMYVFFRTLCSIKAKWMPDMDRHFAAYRLKEERRFYKKFIIARVYEKTDN